MSYLQPVPDHGASADVEALFEHDRASLGYVANYTRLFARRPGVLAAWQQLNGAIKAGMDLRRYELVTLAAARELRSSYCALAHGNVLATRFMPEDELRDLVLDPSAADLDPLDRAIVELAGKVAAGAADITEHDFAPVRALGLTDDEILDVVLAASARCFFSTVLDATGTLPDAAYGELFDQATRNALTVGRRIET